MRSGVGTTTHAATAAGLQRGESILFPERVSSTLRFATLGELAGSQKTPNCLSLDPEHAADGFL